MTIQVYDRKKQRFVNQIASVYTSLDNAALTGIPTAPTAPTGTNTKQLANTEFVQTALANLVDSSPATLDTLNELAAALGDDPNFATTITALIASKQNKLTVGANIAIEGNVISASGGSAFGFLPVSKTIKGIVPLWVVSLPLTAGSYTTTATIGTDSASKTASLDFKKTDGTLLDSITYTGVPTVESAGAGFTLTSDTLVVVSLRGGDAVTQSFILSLGLN